MNNSRILAVASAFALAVASQATLTLLTSRSQVMATDGIDWGQFGAPFTTVADPSTGSTTKGSLFRVQGNMPTTFERRDQGDGWSGDYPTGDHLLWTGETGFSPNSQPMSILLGRTVQALGTQMETDLFESYTATLTAFDALGDNLGSVSEHYAYDPNKPPADLFLGVRSSGNNIASVTFTTVGDSDTNDFAIDTVSLQPCGPVPEPSAFAALAIGGVGLFLRRRK